MRLHRPQQARKYFTVEEANRALVLVSRIVSDVVDEYARLLELQEMLEANQRHGPVALLGRLQSEMADSVDRLQEYLIELEEVGVDLRDFGRGLVDFPSRMGGREVCLCWQFGEPRVAFWHEPNEGLAGRRSVAELEPAGVGASE